MSGVSSELSSSTQLLAVTLYITFLPFWQKTKQNQLNYLAFLKKKLALIRKRTRQSRQIKQRERPKGKQVQSEPEHQGQVVGGGIGHHEDVS